MTTKRVRIRVWWNDWTIITLESGQSRVWGRGGPTDEGYYYNEQRLEWKDDRIIFTAYSEGRDCDGPHKYCWQGSMPVDEVPRIADLDPARNTYFWQEGDCWQRDTFAEMMNY